MADESNIPGASRAMVLGSTEHQRDVMRRFKAARTGAPGDENLGGEPHGRRIARKSAAVRNGSTGIIPMNHHQVQIAAEHSNDPMWYWQANNLPYDLTSTEHLKRIRDLCRQIRVAHPVLGSAMTVFAHYPLTGMEISVKDKALKNFYEELFFDEDTMNYEEFLPEMGLEYWCVGEAFPLGHFSDVLGVWEMDELIDPDDVRVDRDPFSTEPFLRMKVPEWMRKVIQEKKPLWQYEAIMQAAPELAEFAREDSWNEGEDGRGYMPMSNMLMRHLKYKLHTFHPRGLPILLRGFRTLLQEERLNSAQDAIATRLYTPLLLARIGATAQDLGTEQPWIPTQGDLEDFEESVLDALMGDFKMITSHFATDLRPVFGREAMPRFDQDFERITERLLQVFGMSKTLLSGAGGGQTYAADALNRDLITQLLTQYQKMIRRFFRHRARIVAEAQEHWDYTIKGGKRYPVMEEVLVVDEETGEQRITEQPKLLVPDLRFKAMTMASEQDERQFLEALAREGVPISWKSRLTNIPLDLEEEYEIKRQEQVEAVVQEQVTRKQTYHRLVQEGLPVPEDLQRDFGGQAEVTVDPVSGAEVHQEGSPPPTALLPDGTLDPWGPEIDPETGEPVEDPLSDPAGEQPSGEALPRNKMLNRQRPPESDEQRKDMPKAARKIAFLQDPPHVGLRSEAEIDPNKPLDEDDEAA